MPKRFIKTSSLNPFFCESSNIRSNLLTFISKKSSLTLLHFNLLSDLVKKTFNSVRRNPTLTSPWSSRRVMATQWLLLTWQGMATALSPVTDGVLDLCRRVDRGWWNHLDTLFQPSCWREEKKLESRHYTGNWLQKSWVYRLMLCWFIGLLWDRRCLNSNVVKFFKGDEGKVATINAGCRDAILVKRARLLIEQLWSRGVIGPIKGERIIRKPLIAWIDVIN